MVSTRYRRTWFYDPDGVSGLFEAVARAWWSKLREKAPDAHFVALASLVSFITKALARPAVERWPNLGHLTYCRANPLLGLFDRVKVGVISTALALVVRLGGLICILLICIDVLI